jgi:predicted nucleic acid-binding protein
MHAASTDLVLISELAAVEMISLLSRRIRESTLSASDAAALESTFLLHAEREYVTLPVDDLVLTQARALVKAHPLRALDAIQLASARRAGAILSEPITFISSDRNLLTAASAEGLSIDDPLLHP